jgi:DNA-binding MarR family transcriptional regulator
MKKNNELKIVLPVFPLLLELRKHNVDTIAEAIVLFAVADAEERPSLAEVVKSCDMPFSTVSRVVWALHKAGLVKYVADPKDRRIKRLEADLSKLKLKL